MIRMDVATKDATPSKPIPSRTRSHIRENNTSTIDLSSVPLPVVPCGKQHSAPFFRLLLLASLLASCVTHLCPTVANDSTLSMNWKPTRSTARSGHSLEQYHAIIECSLCRHPRPRQRPCFRKWSRSFIISHLYATYAPFIHIIIFAHFFCSVFTCQVSARFRIVITFETWTGGQVN